MTKHWRVILLLVLALAQMTGDVLGIPALKGVAAATCASPAPKVFSAARGLETYSTQFLLQWRGLDGRDHEREIDSALYARLVGPYNRRNVYGAALAYGPVLDADERARPMLDAVLRYALVPPQRRLMAELGIDPAGIVGAVRVRYVPREGAVPPDLRLVIEAPER